MKQKLLFTKAMKSLTFAAFTIGLLGLSLQSNAQTVTANTQSTHNGFFYSFWNDGSQGSASMTLGPAGNYTTKWTNVGNFTAGKGWAVGKVDRVVCFSGSFDGGSNGFLALYGWTKNELIEYYVCESHGSWTPPGNTSDIIKRGTYTSDGGTYTLYTATRTNQPSIVGTATFKQYWSVRSTKRSTGTITFANHVAAWKAAGLNMGTTWDYQIMESEGYGSSGSSNITVSECPTNSCTAPVPTVTSSITYELGATAPALTATGTGLKWYTSETGTSSATAPKPLTTAVGTTVYYVSSTANNCESDKASITVNVVNTYKLYKVSTAVIIDGTIDNAWDDANVKPMNAAKLLSGTVTNAADLSGYAKLLWDNTNLYYLAVVTDNAKQNDSPNSYDDDQVELYVDADNAKAAAYDANDCQYSFGWNDGTVVGTIPATASTTGISYSSIATANGYVIEARLPWSTLKVTPAADKLVGIDFMINDDDDNGTRDGKMSWNSATDEAYQNASLFGTGKLINQVITGIEDIFKTEQNMVYPNPATNELFVKGASKNFDYTILDYSGRTVLEGQGSERIDISNLETGIYYLRLKQGEQITVTKISKM